MRIIACDPAHGYFFLGVNEKELEEQIIPLHEMLLNEYSHDLWPNILVSSVETRKKEIADQKAIKANPFVRKTRLYCCYIREVPDFDAYIVTRADLSELYFVPFDHFAPQHWGITGVWRHFDKRDIQNIEELADIPFTYRGHVYDEEAYWTKEQKAELVDELLDSLPEWKKKGPRKVFRMIMPHYQAYHLFIEDLDALLYKGGVHMPSDWLGQDQMHIKTQADYFDEKEEPFVGKRTLDEEAAIARQMIAEGRSNREWALEILGDYLDGIIDWKICYSLLYEFTPYQNLDHMKDDERKKMLWRQEYDTDPDA